MAGEVVHRARRLADAFRHQRAQTEAAGVVLHPAGLKRGVLPVVAEHQQALAFGVMHHVLGEHVHVRHVDGAHGPRRFAVASGDHAADGTAGEAAGEHPRLLRVLANSVQANGLAAAPAMAAAGDGLWMRGGAVAAEVEQGGADVRLGFAVPLVRIGADQVIDQHHALAAVGCIQGFPPDAGGSSFTAARLLGGEAEALEMRDVVVLAAGGAGGDGKVGAGCGLFGFSFVFFGCRHGFVFCGQPQFRLWRTVWERNDCAADAPHEAMYDGAEQRSAIASRRRAEGEPG